MLTKHICIRFISTLLVICVISSAFAQSGKSFVIGHIDEIQSAVLHEKRILNIYLPDGYVLNDTSRYPVIYLLDGSADEDFIHVVGLAQFCTFPWVNRMPPSIIVGIANTDRRRDFAFPTTMEKDKAQWPTTGGSAKFMQFLAEELQPYIDKQYRTTSSKTLIGQSLGGLLATEILFKHPALFTDYIIISPSLWWDNGSLLQYDAAIYDPAFTQPTGIYIGVGKEGLTPGQFPRVMEVDANQLYDHILHKKSASVSVVFDYLPEDNHATIMHQALYNAIQLLFTPRMK